MKQTWEVYGVNACENSLMLCNKDKVMVTCGLYIPYASIHLKPRVRRINKNTKEFSSPSLSVISSFENESLPLWVKCEFWVCVGSPNFNNIESKPMGLWWEWDWQRDGVNWISCLTKKILVIEVFELLNISIDTPCWIY